MDLDDAPRKVRRPNTPKAAAIAGVLFSVLFMVSFSLIRISLPADFSEGEASLTRNRASLVLALNLLPFAGIAFLWFIGIVRARLGEREDQFFSTVFLGSGLLFLAILFGSMGVAGAMLLAFFRTPYPQSASIYYTLGRAISNELLSNYALRMAGVFMISASTLFLHTKIIPRWLSWLGYILAAVMLFRISQIEHAGWIILAFPMWVMVLSIYILIDNYRQDLSLKGD